MSDNVSFARRFRPTTLDDYVGNAEVKDTVRSYLSKGRPQSILLSGHSGCGKTTMARLLIKEYMCLDPHEDGSPCGVCDNCQSVDEYIQTGNYEMLPDVREIDSADSGGKKDIDALLSTIDYPSMMGGWKAYIIDEAHLLTQAAMGRLLKSLEEPPEMVLMIFCTTNPERLLDTIKNRCQLKLSIKKPEAVDVMSMLKRVCEVEGRKYDTAGLRLISARSDNVIRDALNNIERVFSTKGEATERAVSDEFKEVSDKIIFDFYDAYLKKDYLKYMRVLYRVKTEFGFEQFLSALKNFTVRGVYTINGIDVSGLSVEEMKSYGNLFGKFSVPHLSMVLASLKKMSLGDIETNLIAFIYHEEVQEVALGLSKKESTGTEEITPKEKENLFRNNSLEILARKRDEAGVKSASALTEEVSLSEIGEFISLTKIGGNGGI